MKNFETILADAGITMTEEQKTSITAAMGENYKPIADWQKQIDKVKSLEDKVKTTEEALKAFDGVNPADLNKQIADLKSDLEKKDAEYREQIAERDFTDLLKESIAAVNGKNTKAITALLDLETLKASKNQKEDVAAALKTLSEADDSKMLFGEPEANPVGTGNPIGRVYRNSQTVDDAAMRAAMGLPPVKEQ
ncbi:MAG: phage scaffolding protein [Lachnospiraceae bacterium]|nr:phage scaffolding protein [Lachnospiraceae bacterium]